MKLIKLAWLGRGMQMMKKILLLTILIINVIYNLESSAYAACSWNGNTGTVASPYAASDLTACITDASSKTGDVVIQIPNTSGLSGSISVNMKSGFSNVTGLTIRGQNDCTLDGNDVPTSCGTNASNFFIAYTGASGKSFRLAHMRITGTAGMTIDGGSTTWRLDHLFWDTVTGATSNRIIWLGKSVAAEMPEGLIDHNNVVNWAWGTFVHYQPGSDGGNYEWMTGPQLGTSHAVYLENNRFYSSNGGFYVTDNNGPSRWVFRYNNVTNAYIAGHDAQVDGFRGSLKLELYNNTFTYNASGNCFIVYRSGANGVIYNNTVNVSGSGDLCGNAFAFANYRSDHATATSWPKCESGSLSSYLNSSSNYPQICTSGTGCIPIDGSSSGYPCRDQVGASGNNPQVGGGQPFLLWNNRINGSDASNSVGVQQYGGQHIVANRDYCTTATTMPTSCNGVTTTYTPYTYPHPLVSGSTANIIASDCSNAAIQAAINSASDGDTVNVPICPNGSWSGDVTIPNTKGITLQGAGSGSTVITLNGHTLNLQTSSSKSPVRVTGMRFNHTDAALAITITGTATNWRIDNNIFDDLGISSVYSIRIGSGSPNTDSFTYGVIDHNSFINRNYGTSIFIEWPRGAMDSVAAGDWIWSQTTQRGTSQAVYIEDNVFSGTATASQVVDSRWGAKYVLRYNTIHNPWISTHSGCSNAGRDPIWTEVYKNRFTDDANRYGGSQIEMRSTSGIVWGNTSSSTLNRYGITIDHERSYRTDCNGSIPYNQLCDGTRAWDENAGLHGYRCLGQPGWGPPQAATMGSATFAGMFAWGNLNGGVLSNMFINNNNGYTSEHLVAGRDLFNDANITTGTIGNRPATCSSSLSGRSIYISTDENAQGATIYQCNALNTWTKHWEPYAYPHPLVSGGTTAYLVTPVALSNAHISPVSAQTVTSGLSTSFTITADSGYTAAAAGCGGTLNGSTYTTGAIISNCTVTAVACACDDGNVCTNDSCDPATGNCIHINNTVSCNDGNLCTMGDVCLNGVCAGTPITCNDNNNCTDDTCNTLTGCVFTPKVCNDNNLCTTDTCVPVLPQGCVFTPNTLPCNDNNACTVNDACKNGTCTGTVRNCDDNDSCTIDSCNTATGNCVRTLSPTPGCGSCAGQPNGTQCTDLNACTLNDTCQNGICVPGMARTCNDNNACTADSCDTLNGCVFTINDTLPCFDGNTCTDGDYCLNGICKTGVLRSCDDNNPCTDDKYVPVIAQCCVHAPNNKPCNDNNACTSNDVCNKTNGVCAGRAKNCNDYNACTADSCATATGLCVNTWDPTCPTCIGKPNGTACSDNNACTVDVCTNDVCVSSTPQVCNDNNPCTTDTCNTATGCVFTNNTLPCDDGSSCTVGDTCANGVCVPGPLMSCDDGNVCTTDLMLPIIPGCCTHGVNTLPCNDGNTCTIGDVCANRVCVPGTLKTCDPGLTCDPVTGTCQ